MPKNRELTSTDIETRDVIRKLIKKNGVFPSVRELADAIGVYHYAAQVRLRHLREKGALPEVDEPKRKVTIIRRKSGAKGKRVG
jgi:SOS-response transcriptional repressor LexA